MIPRSTILVSVLIIILALLIIYNHIAHKDSAWPTPDQNYDIQSTFGHHKNLPDVLSSPTHLPRREFKYKIPTNNLTITSPPSWLSCPEATSNTSIWSMATTNKYALYSLVLGVSVIDTWNSNIPLLVKLFPQK